jgi:hypothetical protein
MLLFLTETTTSAQQQSGEGGGEDAAASVSRPKCNICGSYDSYNSAVLTNPDVMIGTLNGHTISCQQSQIAASNGEYTIEQCIKAQSMAMTDGLCGCTSPPVATTSTSTTTMTTTTATEPDTRQNDANNSDDDGVFCALCLSGNPSPSRQGAFIAGVQCGAVLRLGLESMLNQTECVAAQLLADSIR